MTSGSPVGDGSQSHRIDAATAEFEQGEVLGLRRFIYFTISADPARAADAVTVETNESVLLTQTCDVVRPVADRPFVQVAPLIRITDGAVAARCRDGAQPRYAWVPAAGEDAFADLDRIQTIKKDLLVTLEHIPGVTNDDERRIFARAIARKIERFAFPDDLALSLKKLRDRIIRKWDKPESAEGRALQQVLQIRASSHPDWREPAISVHLVFIVEIGVLPKFDEHAPPDPAAVPADDVNPSDVAQSLEDATDPAERAMLWSALGNAWAACCTPTGTVTEVTGEVVGADEYTIDRFWDSSPLDFDYLSGPGEAGT